MSVGSWDEANELEFISLTFKKCKFIDGLYCVICGGEKEGT